MRILLSGRNGQVGWELERTLASLGDVTAVDRARFDLADPDRIRAFVRELKPDLLVNAAAYTAVDKAESETELATVINGSAPGLLAEECKRLGALLVHYSTDYVFDGTNPAPYVENDPPKPINAYGRSKLAGEQAIQAVGGRHLIFRTSWVYGLRGGNFLLTMQRLARERDELFVVNDQIGAPTWSRMIAEASALIIASGRANGLYHLSASGHTSWHDFAERILSSLDWSGKLHAIPSSNYPLPAVRPANSRLCCDRLARDTGIRLPGWEQCLSLCLDRL